MKFSFDCLKNQDYDSTFTKELEVRLNEFASRYFLTSSCKDMFNHQVMALVKRGRTLQDARTEALLVPFLRDSLWCSANSENLWSNMIAKRLCEDLRGWFKDQWVIQKKSGDPYTRSLHYWEPAYCYPKDGRLVVEHCKIDLERKINKTLIDNNFRNYKHNQTEVIKKFMINPRWGNLTKIREKVKHNPINFLKDAFEELAYMWDQKYKDIINEAISGVDTWSMIALTNYSESQRGKGLIAQRKERRELLVNPLPNAFDYIRQFRAMLKQFFDNSSKHKELIECFDLITDSV